MVVEDWGASDWYAWNVKEPLRTIVRTEVMKVNASVIVHTLQAHISKMLVLQRVETGDPFGINRLGQMGLFHTMGDLWQLFYGAHGKVRDITA